MKTPTLVTCLGVSEPAVGQRGEGAGRPRGPRETGKLAQPPPPAQYRDKQGQ